MTSRNPIETRDNTITTNKRIDVGKELNHLTKIDVICVSISFLLVHEEAFRPKVWINYSDAKDTKSFFPFSTKTNQQLCGSGVRAKYHRNHPHSHFLIKQKRF